MTRWREMEGETNENIMGNNDNVKKRMKMNSKQQSTRENEERLSE